jgi:hypothetical protein
MGQPGNQLVDAGVIRGIQRYQRDLVIAAVGDKLTRSFDYLFVRALAYRTVNHAGLAEAAAATAPALYLDGAAVVDDLNKGHDRSRGRGRQL